MRSFFQDVVEKVDYHGIGIGIYCKMHDIVHDFVLFLNKNECFTVEIKEANARRMRISEEVRHLTLMFASFSSRLLDFISAVNCKKLSTLATFDSTMSSIEIKAISQMKCLRTLNLSCSKMKEIPEEIGELIHLRYLDLSGNYMEKLPDSLGNLYNLQTLCLTGCFLIRLPETMGNLINLRHLHNEGCNRLEYLPRGMARLTSLQTLDECTVNDEGLKLGDLGSLDQLQGSLRIKLKENLKDTTSDAEKAPLSNTKLRFLTLWFYEPYQDLEALEINRYGGTRVPSWMISLQNLRYLDFYEWGGCECLPPLGKLPFLEKIDIGQMKKVKTVGDEFLGIMDTQTQGRI